jgi:glycosyltransferase involved in cell wall biosynthesis
MRQVPKTTVSTLPPAPPAKTGWPWTSGVQSRTVRKTDGWPRLSIVTPSFNQGRFIEQTIRSVLLQNYPNLEYIVMDGRSTDETQAVLEKYGDFLSYCRSTPDKGQADALRQGFALASGEILAWINADDFYEPGVFLRAARFFADHKDTVFASGDVNLVDEDGVLIRKLYAMHPSRFFAANLGQHGWPQQGCFWRRGAYEAVGGIDADYQFCMDLDLFVRLVEYGKGRRLPGGPVANFRQHAASKTATQQSMLQQEKARVITRYGRSFWSSKPGTMNALWWFYRKQAAVRLRWERLTGQGSSQQAASRR